MITREEAKKIAEKHIKDNQLGTGVSDVYLYDEIPYRKPVYYSSEIMNITDYWIAYIIENSDCCIIKSSTIAVISKKSGSIDYFGSAGDEG